MRVFLSHRRKMCRIVFVSRDLHAYAYRIEMSYRFQFVRARVTAARRVHVTRFTLAIHRFYRFEVF